MSAIVDDEKSTEIREENAAFHKHEGLNANEVDSDGLTPGVSRAAFAHINEKKLLRRMDFHLLPTLTMLYLLSFIDRGNIVSIFSLDAVLQD